MQNAVICLAILLDISSTYQASIEFVSFKRSLAMIKNISYSYLILEIFQFTWYVNEQPVTSFLVKRPFDNFHNKLYLRCCSTKLLESLYDGLMFETEQLHIKTLLLYECISLLTTLSRKKNCFHPAIIKHCISFCFSPRLQNAGRNMHGLLRLNINFWTDYKQKITFCRLKRSRRINLPWITIFWYGAVQFNELNYCIKFQLTSLNNIRDLTNFK